MLIFQFWQHAISLDKQPSGVRKSCGNREKISLIGVCDKYSGRWAWLLSVIYNVGVRLRGIMYDLYYDGPTRQKLGRRSVTIFLKRRKYLFRFLLLFVSSPPSSTSNVVRCRRHLCRSGKRSLWCRKESYWTKIYFSFNAFQPKPIIPPFILCPNGFLFNELVISFVRLQLMLQFVDVASLLWRPQRQSSDVHAIGWTAEWMQMAVSFTKDNSQRPSSIHKIQ